MQPIATDRVVWYLSVCEPCKIGYADHDAVWDVKLMEMIHSPQYDTPIRDQENIPLDGLSFTMNVVKLITIVF